MQRTTIYLAWAAAILAFLAWLFVGWFALNLQSMQAQHLSDAQVSASALSKGSAASDLHAQLQESASERTQLAALTNVDPTSFADTINQAGTTAGVDLKVQSAAPETQTVANSPTQAFDFSLAAQGSFAQVFYAAQLLESLPVPSSIVNLQLIKGQGSDSTQSGAWQINAQLRIITAATISS